MCFGDIDAQNIVLNAVAIGFVYELDELLYVAVLAQPHREAWEAQPPHPFSAFAARNGKRIVGLYSWATCLLDFAFGAYYYMWYSDILVERTYKQAYHSFFILTPYLMLRAALLAIAQMHLALARVNKGSRAYVWLKVLALAVLIVGYAALILTVLLAGGLEAFFAAIPEAVIENTYTAECVGAPGYDVDVVEVTIAGETVKCVDIHKYRDGLVFENLSATASAYTSSTFMHWAWNSQYYVWGYAENRGSATRTSPVRNDTAWDVITSNATVPLNRTSENATR